MEKKILLIEGEGDTARKLSATLSARGFAVRVAADGPSGLELARADRPDAIVLAAELPGGSGYAICNKLKKDDRLREVPVVLTSATATEETFEQHRKLKTRAEDYLRKPFAPAALAAKIGALLGIPAGDGAADVVTADDVVEIDGTLAALEDAARTPVAVDDADLSAFDAAFDSIAHDDGPPGALSPPPTVEELAADPGASDEADPSAEPGATPEPDAGAGVEIDLSAEPAAEPGVPAVAAAGGAAPEDPAAQDALDAAPAGAPGNPELSRLQDRISELRVDAGRRADERDGLAAELAAARAELDEARRRIADLEAQVATHEQRVVKAYQRLKGDERVREKTRKALAIALELLDAGPATRPAVPDRPPEG